MLDIGKKLVTKGLVIIRVDVIGKTAIVEESYHIEQNLIFFGC